MNPLFHTGFSISDSLKSVLKSVLIYETIIQEIQLLVTTRKCKNAKLIHMKMPQKPQYIEACDGLHWIYRKLDLIKSYFYDMI